MKGVTLPRRRLVEGIKSSHSGRMSRYPGGFPLFRKAPSHHVKWQPLRLLRQLGERPYHTSNIRPMLAG